MPTNYNFIKKDTFLQMTSSKVSLTGSSKSMFAAYTPVEYKSFSKNQLGYTTTHTNKSEFAILEYKDTGGTEVAPYRNLIESLYPNVVNGSYSSKLSILKFNKSDSFARGSYKLYMDNSIGTRDIEDYQLDSSSPYYKRVGELKGTSVAAAEGYIFYEEGVIVLFGTAAFRMYLGGNDTGNDYISYRTIQDQYKWTFYCPVNSDLIGSSSNPSYFTSIDVTDSSITSALTSYWSETNQSSLTISGDASNGILIKEQEYSPYVTIVGLYNDNNECLAVAALKEPFKLHTDLDMTFKIEINM